MKNELNKEYTAQNEGELKENEPSLFQVLVHNDDFTPMEFVMGILEKFFYMDRQRAMSVMYEAHTKGKALCGLFSKDIAESKVAEVIEYALTNEHPLHCSTEAA